MMYYRGHYRLVAGIVAPPASVSFLIFQNDNATGLRINQ